ncbi:MAG: nucleotide exchange factor GrpE [Bacteroidota bacterium]
MPDSHEEDVRVDAKTAEMPADEERDVDAEIQELKDQNLRLYAEFENFRRRNARERLELISTAGEKVIKSVLPILDDFDRALKTLQEGSERQGLELIQTKLISALKAEGLKPMDSTVGQAFDVERMEAITNIPAPTPELAGCVLDELEKGYLLGDKIIRYAKVVVGQTAE